jgi:hypothetical protein
MKAATWRLKKERKEERRALYQKMEKWEWTDTSSFHFGEFLYSLGEINKYIN